VAELGPPPAPFAFLALGSEGRQERSPGSDQDNALLFEAAAGAEAEAARPYFLDLGARVCAGLEAAGVPRCPGGVMADNPAWCATLEQWRSHFARWIRQPEPAELLDFNIFFDFRAAGGQPEAAGRLRAAVEELLADNPPFFLHCARDARERRLPAAHKDGLDAKQAMAPLVGFARLYALKNGVRAGGTCERLGELRERGLLDGRLVEEALQAYELLARLRLQAQLAGRGSLVDPAALPHAEQTLLREALALNGLLQKRIGFDFLGGAG